MLVVFAGKKAFMDTLASLWKRAGRPDANLGKGEVGPSPQHVTMTPLLRVLDAMQIDGDSVFVDIGSGHGLVAFAAALYAGARLSYGIEIDSVLHQFSVQQAREVFAGEPPEQWPVRLLHADVAEVAHPFDWTHSYSFDKDFPPAVLARVAALFRSSTRWRVFASSLPERRWREVAGAGWWDRSVRLRERQPVNISGSGEQHSIYVYERIDRAPTRRSVRLARVAALRDEQALARSRYEAHFHPTLFGSEAHPNRWIPGAVTRLLVRSGGVDAFECALPGLDGELDLDRARMLASRGFYDQDPSFSERSEVDDYLKTRSRRPPAPAPVDIRDEAELTEQSVESAVSDFAEEIKQEPSAGDIERAVETEREQEVVREKRSIDAYHALVARLDRHLMRGARFLDLPIVGIVSRRDYADELKDRPRPSDDLPETILAAPGQATQGMAAALASDALRVAAERALIAQMEDLDLLVRPVPPGRIRDLASMPGFTPAMHCWMPLVYSLFAFSCSMDISLLSYGPMPDERYEAVTTVARLINYIRDAKFEALESTEPDATVPQRAALAADLGILAERAAAAAAPTLSALVRGLPLRDFRPAEFSSPRMSFLDIVRTASAQRGSVPASLWIELKEGVRPSIEANAVYRVTWKVGENGFGYSVRSFVLTEQARKRGQPPREIVLARDEELEWHLFDCSGRRQGVCMPFAVPIGRRNPVRAGAHKVEDPLEEARDWLYSYDKASGSVFVLLERDMDALADLHEEYPHPPPSTPVATNSTFEAALATDLAIRRNPPSSSLAVRTPYPETRLEDASLVGGLPAFEGDSVPMRYEGSPRAMAVALALFHMNDSIDVPLLLRYPIQEPIQEPNRPDVAQQIATDRLVGLVVAPMRLRGWERIRKTRFAVARHYLTDRPGLLVSDSFRFLKWFYDLGNYDSLTRKIIAGVRVAIDNRPWWMKKATAAAWMAVKTALAAGVVAGVGKAGAAVYAAPSETIEAALVVGGAAFHYGLEAALALGSAAGSAAVRNPRVSLTAAALVAGARPAESLAYLFGFSALTGRVAASKAPIADRTRFAFKLYFSDTVSLDKFAKVAPGSADGGAAAVLDDEQLRAILQFVRNGLAIDNPAYAAVAVKEQRAFPRALVVVDRSSDDDRLRALLADQSAETWLELAGQQRDLPAFSIAAFFNLSDATVARSVAEASRVPLRLESAAGTYDLAAIVWRSGPSDYLLIERNKQGTYWCLRVSPGNVQSLGTVSRRDLRDALSVSDAPLWVHTSGRKSLWPRDSGERAIWRRCTFVLYNNSLLYPALVH